MTRVRGKGGFSGLVDLLLPAGGLVAATTVWWLAAAMLDVPPFLLPAPGAVAALLLESPAVYLWNALATLEKILLGGAIGITGGFGLAVLVAYLPWFRRAVYPYLVTVRVLPKIAIAPLLLIYLGTGTTTAVVFVALVAFFPMVLSTAAGFDRAPAEQRDLLRSVNAGPLTRFLRLDLPYALPDVFAGLKQAVTLAVVGAVVAEWIVADSGLGFLVLLGSENVRADIILAALAVLLAVGLALYGSVALAQRVVGWTATSDR